MSEKKFSVKLFHGRDLQSEMHGLSLDEATAAITEHMNSELPARGEMRTPVASATRSDGHEFNVSELLMAKKNSELREYLSHDFDQDRDLISGIFGDN